MKVNQVKATLTIPQAAEYIGVGDKVVREWTHRDNPETRIPGFYVNSPYNPESKRRGHYRIITALIPKFLWEEGQRQMEGERL